MDGWLANFCFLSLFLEALELMSSNVLLFFYLVGSGAYSFSIISGREWSLLLTFHIRSLNGNADEQHGTRFAWARANVSSSDKFHEQKI